MSVHFEHLVPVRDFKPSSLKALLERILKKESRPDCDLTVIFTDSAHLRRLNRRYRGRDRVTDVISFAMTEGADSRYNAKELGDVFISLSTKPWPGRRSKGWRSTGYCTFWDTTMSNPARPAKCSAGKNSTFTGIAPAN
jgi:hypothetical protein